MKVYSSLLSLICAASPKATWVREPTFLLHRTHTANYMHALVDDYLGDIL